MDDTDLVLSYLFEMHTTEQEATLTTDDLTLLMDYIINLQQLAELGRRDLVSSTPSDIKSAKSA